VLLGKPSLLQRFAGERPTFTRATVWKLQDYDAEPEPSTAALPLADAAPLTPPQTGAAEDAEGDRPV